MQINQQSIELAQKVATPTVPKKSVYCKFISVESDFVNKQASTGWFRFLCRVSAAVAYAILG